MQIIDKRIEISDLQALNSGYFDDMLKGVVDVKRELLAVDAELHSDLEGLLLENGSSQEDLWGINLIFDEDELDELVEFDSLINIRPKQNNRSRYVEDKSRRNKILEVVAKWIIL